MEIFKYILPAFIVMMTAYLLFDKMMSNEEKKRKHEQTGNSANTIVSIRLRAYERIMLLLERTNPGSMLVHLIKPGMNNIELQTKLLEHIRLEFEHNFSQQIYVSDTLWKAVSITRENLTKLINATASKFAPDEPATKLAESIIRIYAESETNPTEVAISILKEETRNQFFTRE